MKPIIWVASTKDDLMCLPKGIQEEVGYALYLAQIGLKSYKVKIFLGFGNASVLEIRENDSAGTYRAVYTVKFEKAIAVLHIFQKKSKAGISTPKQEVDLIKSRFKLAEIKYKKWLTDRNNNEE